MKPPPTNFLIQITLSNRIISLDSNTSLGPPVLIKYEMQATQQP